MSRHPSSADSLTEANRDRAEFSRHGNSKGAAGYSTEGEAGTSFLAKTGDVAIINPQDHGFGEIRIGASWDKALLKDRRFPGKLWGRRLLRAVDLDLGCLYELNDGRRGAVQPFGHMYGAYDYPPFITLSGDERTGAAVGEDETIRINGKMWADIKRVLFYIYIYEGAPHWEQVKPRITIRVPGEVPLVASPSISHKNLPVCVIAGIENIRNGIKMTNYTEYFAGHAEMDRAFGFGLHWADGQK